jgi:hypothetical protein
MEGSFLVQKSEFLYILVVQPPLSRLEIYYSKELKEVIHKK